MHLHLRHVLALLTVTTACANPNPTDMGGPLAPENERIATLSGDEVGPQGFTGDALLEAARETYGTMSLTWADTPDVAPASDVWSLTLGAPTFEHRRVHPFDPAVAARDYLQIVVSADLENGDGTLRAADLPLILLTPDLDTYGPFLVGGGAITVDGAYAQTLSIPHHTGRFEVGFHAHTAQDLLEPGRTIEAAPQRITLVTWHQSATSSGSHLIYGCGGDAPCTE